MFGPEFDKFALHNQHWENEERFSQHDPHLGRLKNLPYIYSPPLLQKFPYSEPGIYLIEGGRQVGKTTFLKQSMQTLIKKSKFSTKNLLFLSGEVIYSPEELRRLLTQFLENRTGSTVIIIDEVNYIPDWDRTVKFIADSGLLKNCCLILSGSDGVIIKQAMKRFPGRRGKSIQTNFHYYPLSFSEFLGLKAFLDSNLIEEIRTHSYETLTNHSIVAETQEQLFQAFREYALTGGYLVAINDFAVHKKISTSTLTTYWEWIVGDILKQKKTENYLREILGGILKRHGTPITWNSLAKDMSIDHHKTVSDYCDLLNQMDAIFIQPALLQHKQAAAPKKGRKIYFTDPFIHHAVYSMITSIGDPWNDYLKPLFDGDPEQLAPFAEEIVITHCRRKYPTYYIKEMGEIDLAYKKENKIIPAEIKWTSQLRLKDLTTILQQKSGFIIARMPNVSRMGNQRVVPLPLFLLKEFD